MSMLVASASTIAATATAVASSAATAGAEATTEPGIVSLVTTVVPSLIATVLPSGVVTEGAAQAGRVVIPQYYELLAAFAGGLAGSAKGVRLRFDSIGVATLAVVAGLGGGIIRDVLLQNQGIYAFQHQAMLAVTILAAIVGFFFASVVRTMSRPLLILDTISLALFAVLGSDKALIAGLALLPAILLGTITSVGGGVLRDMLCSEQPELMRPGSLYASAAVAGSTVYVLMVGWLGIVKPIASVSAFIVIALLRSLSLLLGWQSPEPVDLTPHVVSVGKTVLSPVRRYGPWKGGGTGASSASADEWSADAEDTEGESREDPPS